jgi:dienelactone hydrolase
MRSLHYLPLVFFGLSLLRSADASVPKFDLEGEKWTWSDGGRSFSGYLLKPDGSGPFPAVIINHGKGGRPDQFSVNWAREMVKWGLVAICPTLTHVAGTDIQGKDGASQENLQRGRDCLTMLNRLGYVDAKRVAVVGHSMGGYLTIGLSGLAGSAVKAMAVSAGGVTPEQGRPMPSIELASGITAPTLMLHGVVDGAVPLRSSQLLKEVLDQRGVPNRRVVFEAINHDLPTNPATRTVMLTLIREWFIEQGVIPQPDNSAPTISTPADCQAPAGSALGPVTFQVGDEETPAVKLKVTAVSSCLRVLRVGDIALSGEGAERTLTARLVGDQAGPLTILLTVSDGDRTTTTSFVVGVTDATGAVPDPTPERGNPNRRMREPTPR